MPCFLKKSLVRLITRMSSHTMILMSMRKLQLFGHITRGLLKMVLMAITVLTIAECSHLSSD